MILHQQLPDPNLNALLQGVDHDYRVALRDAIAAELARASAAARVAQAQAQRYRAALARYASAPQVTITRTDIECALYDAWEYAEHEGGVESIAIVFDERTAQVRIEETLANAGEHFDRVPPLTRYVGSWEVPTREEVGLPEGRASDYETEASLVKAVQWSAGEIARRANAEAWGVRVVDTRRRTRALVHAAPALSNSQACDHVR